MYMTHDPSTRVLLPFHTDWWFENDIEDGIEPIEIAPHFSLTDVEAETVLVNLADDRNWLRLVGENDRQHMNQVHREVALAKRARPIDACGRTMVVSWR